MALSIGVKAGSRIKFGQRVLEVLHVEDGRRIQVKVTGEDENRQYLITEEQRTLIGPETYVFCGVGKDWHDPAFSRIAFEAPRAIKINRV